MLVTPLVERLLPIPENLPSPNFFLFICPRFHFRRSPDFPTFPFDFRSAGPCGDLRLSQEHSRDRRTQTGKEGSSCFLATTSQRQKGAYIFHFTFNRELKVGDLYSLLH